MLVDRMALLLPENRRVGVKGSERSSVFPA